MVVTENPEGKTMGFGVTDLGSDPASHHFLTGVVLASYLTSLWPDFPAVPWE